MPKARILFVEDDPAGRELGAFNLTQAGFEVDVAASGEEGLEFFRPDRYDVVVTDLRMPGISGLDLLERVKAQDAEIPVLVITAYGDVETAVRAMRAGAYDFIGKPFNREHLLLTLRRAIESSRLRDEVRQLKIRASGVERHIIHRSASMTRALDVADRVAPTDATVLVTGETGTGKELVARRIHVRSARADGPFVTINCASMPAELLEAELFGHTKGAFTGATRARKGRFRQAEGGTIFLDEVGELPPMLQGKLLRVLQERYVDVVGSDEPIRVDVRVIAATNRTLSHEVREGAFRADLLYRLGGFEVRLPPLRERPDDILLLAHHFVETLAPGRELLTPAPLVAELLSRSWPGNVRELENACERLVILCKGDELRVEDLPGIDPESPPPSRGMDGWPPLPPEGLGLVDLEKGVIERVLALKKGNVTRAAEYLRVPRHILAYRMEKYGIRRQRR